MRRHLPLRVSRDADLEFVYGAVVEDGTRTTGHFLASVRIDPDGLIAAYQVSFDTELALVATGPAREERNEHHARPGRTGSRRWTPRTPTTS